MTVGTVDAILPGSADQTGEKIEDVYSKVSGVYAVYRTAERVMVQFADDQALGSEQRLALAPLNPIRGEINGLIDGWRQAQRFNAAKKHARARMFDRRTADALTVALQGDQVHGEELLKAVRADIFEERVSIGRMEYLAVAAISAAALFLVFLFISWLAEWDESLGGALDFMFAEHLWLATGVGCLGALFSIALGIRSREIKTDLQRRDNVVDAMLRVLIGAVSAVLLFSLFKSGLIRLTLGERLISLPSGSTATLGGTTLHTAVVAAFLAGFSERLVGNFLSTTVLTGASAAGATIAAPAADTSNVPPKSEANELNPRGKSERGKPTSDEATESDAAEAHHHEDGVDGCVCDLPLDDAEMTDDTELPEATGGVEQPLRR